MCSSNGGQGTFERALTNGVNRTYVLKELNGEGHTTGYVVFSVTEMILQWQALTFCTPLFVGMIGETFCPPLCDYMMRVCTTTRVQNNAPNPMMCCTDDIDTQAQVNNGWRQGHACVCSSFLLATLLPITPV